MPVEKFRSVAEMPAPSRRHPGDPALYRVIASLWETSRRLRPPRQFPAGVYRHRSIDSMNEQRKAWDADYFSAIRAARRG